MPKKGASATKAERAEADPKPKASKAEKAPRIRKRVLEDRTSKDGKQVCVLFYVPREHLETIMDREKLGSSFGEAVRGYVEEMPENPPQPELPEGLVGRGVYVPLATVQRIAKFEKDGGNVDRYVWSRLKRKLGIGGSD